MPQKPRARRYSNEDKRQSQIFTSPDGIRMQITAGNKLQHIRALARDSQITDAQFRVLVLLVDTTDEGYGDQENWGFSYLKYETLAAEVGKSESAAKRIVKELETGERESGTGTRKKIIQGKVMLDAIRSGSKGGRSNVNKYSLRTWAQFAAVEETAKGPVDVVIEPENGSVRGEKGPVFERETVRFSGPKGPAAGPDSPVPTFKPTQDSPESCRVESVPANDNLSIGDMIDQLLEVYPPDSPESRHECTSLLEAALDSGARFEQDILDAARSYRRHVDAWRGDRATKPLTRFLGCEAWKNRTWEKEMPPAGYIPECARPWPSDWRDRFWIAYGVRKNVRETERVLETVAKTEMVSFEGIQAAVRKYRRGLTDTKYIKDPVKWLADEPWRSVDQTPSRLQRSVRTRMNVAI